MCRLFLDGYVVDVRTNRSTTAIRINDSVVSIKKDDKDGDETYDSKKHDNNNKDHCDFWKCGLSDGRINYHVALIMYMLGYKFPHGDHVIDIIVIDIIVINMCHPLNCSVQPNHTHETTAT